MMMKLLTKMQNNNNWRRNSSPYSKLGNKRAKTSSCRELGSSRTLKRRSLIRTRIRMKNRSRRNRRENLRRNDCL
mgnify:CR=1 FL=1